MKLDTVVRICRAVDNLSSGGERFVWAGLTHISQRVNCNRSTAWRNLEKLVELGYVRKEESKYHEGDAIRYRLTEQGHEFLGSQRTYI